MIQNLIFGVNIISEHHQSYFLISDFLAESLKVNKKLAKNII